MPASTFDQQRFRKTYSFFRPRPQPISIGGDMIVAGAVVFDGGPVTDKNIRSDRGTDQSLVNSTGTKGQVNLGSSTDADPAYDVGTLSNFSAILSGDNGIVSGTYAVIIGGNYCEAIGDYSIAAGNGTIAGGYGSVAFGYQTQADGDYSSVEGYYTTTYVGADASHAEGYYTTVGSNYSHVEGWGSSTTGGYYSPASHAEGYYCSANAYSSHAEGFQANASGNYSHAEGKDTYTTGTASHAEGDSTSSGGQGAHAEGISTHATNHSSHAEGEQTYATGISSHAEGYYGQAIGYASHTEGFVAVGAGNYSHAEGSWTSTGGNAQGGHSEGNYSRVTGYGAHAEGYDSFAEANHSHAAGTLSYAWLPGMFAQTSCTYITGSEYRRSTGTTTGTGNAQRAWVVAGGTSQNGNIVQLALDEVDYVLSGLNPAPVALTLVENCAYNMNVRIIAGMSGFAPAMWVQDILAQRGSGSVELISVNDTLSVPNGSGYNFNIVAAGTALNIYFTGSVSQANVRATALVDMTMHHFA